MIERTRLLTPSAADPTPDDRTRLAMSDPVHATPNPSETALNLAKDGGRRVMYGGDPYEDDVERDSPSSTSLNAMPARGDMGK
jgi:hypothetical protein